MEVKNAETAREWLRSWGSKAFTLNRAERLAQDMDGCAMTINYLSPERAAGFRAAATTLREAIAANT